jgi:lipoyl-dependent peroxiredoxin
MADIKRHATATWQGDTKSGSGKLSGESGEFEDVFHSFPSRFAQESGSNPEEFIGAAHAACYNMVIVKELTERGNPPENLETRAAVTLKEDGGGYAVTAIHLQTEASVPGIDQATFTEVAEIARDNCPISQLLKPGLEEITIEAKLA